MVTPTQAVEAAHVAAFALGPRGPLLRSIYAAQAGSAAFASSAR